ncbi:hypothetical protein NKH18_42835 [Streptomyces sp. M10(2022)]
MQQAQHGGEFYVASAMQIYNDLLEEAPELLGLYYAGVFYDYRGEEPRAPRRRTRTPSTATSTAS